MTSAALALSAASDFETAARPAPAPDWLAREVSPESARRLAIFVEAVEKWSRKINLVSKSSLVEIWNRHVLDSIQAYRVAGHESENGKSAGVAGPEEAICSRPSGPARAKVAVVPEVSEDCASGQARDADRHWADIGSGGGFPGLVVAILADELAPGLRVSLVESDRRKSEFLRHAVRACDLRHSVEVIPERAERIEPLNAGILSARALAALPDLLALAERHLASGGCAVFPKGATWKQEVEAARLAWRFRLESARSRTDPKAAILKIRDVSRA